MSTSPIVNSFGAIATFTGAGIPTAFADPAAAAVRQIAATDACVAWVKVVTTSATNLTSVDIEIVDSYDGSAGSWCANYIDAASATSGTVTYGSGSNQTIANVTVTNSTTYWIKLVSYKVRMNPGGASISVKANGGAGKTGESVTLYLVTSTGI